MVKQEEEFIKYILNLKKYCFIFKFIIHKFLLNLSGNIKLNYLFLILKNIFILKTILLKIIFNIHYLRAITLNQIFNIITKFLNHYIEDIKFDLNKKLSFLTNCIYTKQDNYNNLINFWKKNNELLGTSLYIEIQNIIQFTQKSNICDNFQFLDIKKEIDNDILFLKKWKKKIIKVLFFIEKRQFKELEDLKVVEEPFKSVKAKPYNEETDFNDTFFNSYYFNDKMWKSYV